MMIYTNALLDADFLIDKSHLAILIKLLNPFAPHITEEIWQTVLLKKKPLELEPWPKWEEKNMVKKTAIIAVQINGKFRGNVETPIGLNQIDVLNLAQKIEAINKYLEHQNIRKIVYIQDKLLNVVI
jgi:leucyl-tRNA synthetase